MSEPTERCLTPRELAQRWRCRPAAVRGLIRRGVLPAIQLGGRVRVPPEAIRQAEQGLLAVRPRAGRRQERVDPEIAALLAGDSTP
jgi:excisionase family DNA binding protein